MTSLDRLREGIWRAWTTHRVLAAATLAFVGMLAGSALMLGIDGREYGGQLVWIKPAKFAASSAIYCGTLLGLIGSVARPAWGLRRAGSVAAWVLLLDVALVAIQAARGTQSHFNVGTPFDAGLWALMGVSILVLVIASAVFAVALIRSPVLDRAWGWALRLGMAVSVAGATLGGLMTGATEAQAAALATGARPAAIGAHTVGAADGGAGLPGVGWSRDHGDLRIPHFVGLHALQAIPLLSLLAFRLFRPARESTRLGLVIVLSASYAGLIGLLTVQALAGRPPWRIDGSSLAALGGWAALTALGVLLALAPERSRADRPAPLAVGT